MGNIYKTIDNSFHQEIERLAAEKKLVKFNYITDLREVLTAASVIKELFSKDGAEYVTLSSGEEIRLDRIVRINNTTSPDYGDYDFSNSCTL